MKTGTLISVILGVLAVNACTITHKVEPSDQPIKIDLNVHISQEIRLKVEKPVEDLIADNPDIF